MGTNEIVDENKIENEKFWDAACLCLQATKRCRSKLSRFIHVSRESERDVSYTHITCMFAVSSTISTEFYHSKNSGLASDSGIWIDLQLDAKRPKRVQMQFTVHV